MKPIKFVTATLGILFVISVFLPFFKVLDQSISLWQARAVGHSAPTMIVLISSLIVLGLSALAINGRMTRLLAAGIMVASFVALGTAFIQFADDHKGAIPALMQLGGIGARVLVFGGLLSFVVSLIALIKPEPATR